MRRSNGYRIRLLLIGFIASIVLGGVGHANATTITVGLGGGCDFDSIQAGINSANEGDTVFVKPGEYVITIPITFRGRAITVRSEAGPDETTIRMGTPSDADRGSVIIFENNETTASVLEGFTITGGRGSLVLSINQLCGGGIFFNASSGTVRNCKIVQNSGDAGGGIFCAYACSPILIDCIIAENSAGSAGGGGGPWSGASLNLTNCIIRGNSAWSAAYGTGVGGGAWCDENSSMTMSDCAIITNTARTGGGVFWEANASVTLTRCIVAGNTAVWGGGLGGWSPGSMTICNCTIWGNSADANGGGVGCYNGASAKVTNSILWANTAASGKEILLDQAPAQISITYSNVSGGQSGIRNDGGSLSWGAGNIDADPLVTDPNNGDFHLKSEAGRWDPVSEGWVVDGVTSPCIDRGDPIRTVGDELMPNGGIINMGAYGGTAEASMSIGTPPLLLPMAHWTLDEADGTVAYDSAGENDADVFGGAIWQPTSGKVNGALEFDGIDDYISTPFVLNPSGGAFRVVVWIKGGALGQAFLSQANGVNWLCMDSVEGCLITELKASGRARAPLRSQIVITDGEWHRTALAWDGTYRYLYVDGVEVAIDAAPLSGLESAEDGLYFGADSTLAPGTFFSGLIDDVRIYNRAVSP